MENIDKAKALLEWLGVEDVEKEVENVEDLFDGEYEYDTSNYNIYTEEELDNKIDEIVKMFAEETQNSIDQLSDDILYKYYMDIQVDIATIEMDISETIANYVGNGNMYEYEDFYIFPLD